MDGLPADRLLRVDGVLVREVYSCSSGSSAVSREDASGLDLAISSRTWISGAEEAEGML